MTHNRLKQPSGVVTGTSVFALLFLLTLTAGCGPHKAATRSDEEKQFLAPTDVSKLRPEAREALRHMPGGDMSQAPNSAAPAPK